MEKIASGQPVDPVKVLIRRYQGVVNKQASIAREQSAGLNLRIQYPDGSVQSEKYLRDANNVIIKDPITGKARRIDFVVFVGDAAVDSVEVTSLNAPKGQQILRENRIRNAGGIYVLDVRTGKLVDISAVQTRILRVR